MSFDPKLKQLASTNNTNNTNNIALNQGAVRDGAGIVANNILNINNIGVGGGDQEVIDANALALTMLPRLQGVLRGLFAGPHTQFACACLAATAPVSTATGSSTGNNNDDEYSSPSPKNNNNNNNRPSSSSPYIVKHVIIVITCTQIFVCDDQAYVQRVIHLERLLAVYVRPVDSPKLTGGIGANTNENLYSSTAKAKEGTELEILLVIDGEHDLLLQGRMTCDGIPPKPLVPLLQVLHENVKPVAPLVVHSNNPAPLAEIARLQVPATYKAPLPIREETNENCPCWREGDVIHISMQEFEQRVTNMFTVYDPHRLATVKDVCRRFAHRKGGAIQHLTDKYGPEPTAEHAAAVAKILTRENFSQSLFAQAGARQPTFSAITASQRSNESAPKEIPVDPLYFPALILMQRPSGGAPRVTLHISPAPAIPSGVSSYSPYIRAGYLDGYRTPQSQLREKEFWYLSNEGFALNFDVTNESLRPFGFAHGDRVLATVGITSGKMSTVIGVRDGTLWVHDEGTLGACALVGFRNHEDLERLNGWMLVESSHVNELREMEVITVGGFVETLDITPETVYPAFGFFHGEVVASKRACSQPTAEAVILGVTRTGELYVQWLITSDAQLQELRSKQNQIQQQNSSLNPTSSGGLKSTNPQSPIGGAGRFGGGFDQNNSIHQSSAAVKPLLAVDTDASAASNNMTVFQRKKLPQKESGAVARNASSVGQWRSKEDLIKSHGWVPIGCRKVCVASARKHTGAPPTLE